MKNLCLFTLLLITVFRLSGQNKFPLNNIVITSENKKTQVIINKNGQLSLNVSPENIRKFKAKGILFYSDFGAKGDGKTDDIGAIAATHAFANKHQLLVEADQGATYYISGKDLTAVIQTDTNFGSANFIIDDTNVQNINSSVFLVSSDFKPYKLKGISSLKKNQKKINNTFAQTSLVTVNNSEIKQYIRFGPNQNSGSTKTDTFIVDKNGNINVSAPIIWDFNQITSVMVLPIDEKTLKISGGIFTTIANQAESKYTYYHRNISIERSNVILDGLRHNIIEEKNNGAPYGGFITIKNCTDVTIKNTKLTGHKTYETIGSAGVPVKMGSYDILVEGALNISFINCTQTNDINDNTFWGIMGSNYSKNLLYDGCELSRFDAHKGVANATIRNSTLGYMGINAIGSGVFTVENTRVNSRFFMNLRRDYGSSWEGEFIIRNCIFVPKYNKTKKVVIIGAVNSGKHDFGYTTYMPEKIIFENFHIDQSSFPNDKISMSILDNFNPEITNNSYEEQFPYVRTKEVILKNVTTSNGLELKISENPFLYKGIKIIKK